jgi:prepilin-type N-terminal cleavage/methylation domain-containing protein
MSNSGFPKRHAKFFRGLSLIEVCVAIAILAIILVSLSGIFNQGYRFLRKTRMNHLACLLAQDQMENLMNEYIFADISSFNGNATLSAPFQDFNGQVNISYPASGGSNSDVNANLSRVNVTISWQGQSGVQNFTLTTLVCNFTH